MALNASPERDAVDLETPLSHKFFKVAETVRPPKAPATAQNDDLVSKCRPLNNAGFIFAMNSQDYQTSQLQFATHPSGRCFCDPQRDLFRATGG